jgi:hypothetical protein
MSKIILGKSGGHNVGFEIDELLPTRLLIQANSGGGKSYVIRRILEQAFGKIQCFVIDVAGEFASLREKYGYVLVGEHGETPVDIRSAGLVAEKLLELRASAVFDLYSLKPPSDRHIWVKHFLAAMMNAPKKLWHPVLVMVDEAHKFMPEKGEGESEAKAEMLSLCSDGRKYGWCAGLATQRLSKLDKSGASELLNVLIGPTFIDVDLERAHKTLGLVKADYAAFDEQMKTIAPGNFWALGRAISKKRILVKIGEVVTTHPKPGVAHATAPPPPPDKIKGLLPKLADLPQEAETKARTEAEFRREIRELKTKLSQAEKNAAARQTRPVQTVARFENIAQIRAALREAVKLMTKLSSLQVQVASVDRADVEAAVRAAVDRILGLTERAYTAKQKQVDQIRREAKPMLDLLQQLLSAQDAPGLAVVPTAPAANKAAPTNGEAKTAAPGPAVIDGDFKVGLSHRKIAGILAAYYPDPVKRSILAAMCGRVDGGGFGNNISECRQAGLIEDVSPGVLRATEKGAREFAGVFHAPTSTDEMLALWRPRLSGSAASILQYLVDHPDPIHRAELASAVGRVDGGGFGNNLSELRVAGLLVDAAKGHVQVNKPAMFMEVA